MFSHRIKPMLVSLARADFLRREDGVIAIEAMIIMPVMFWAFLSMFSIFDAFRTYSITQKAAYTVGDAVSRETAPIDSDYLTGVLDMFEYLSGSQGNSSLRITSLVYDAGDDRFYRDWSQTRGNKQPLRNSDIANWKDKLPVMPDRERIVLVETWTTYEPPFATGLEQREIRTFVFTRPRYAPRVCWVECADGV